MKTSIQRWGNSLGVRIPSAIAKKLSLHPRYYYRIQDRRRAHCFISEAIFIIRYG